MTQNGDKLVVQLNLLHDCAGLHSTVPCKPQTKTNTIHGAAHGLVGVTNITQAPTHAEMFIAPGLGADLSRLKLHLTDPTGNVLICLLPAQNMFRTTTATLEATQAAQAQGVRLREGEGLRALPG